METQQSQQPTYQERQKLRHQEKMKEDRQKKLKKLYRQFALWLLLALVVGAGIFGMVKLASRSPQDNGPVITPGAVSAEDWVKGSNRDAKTVLIEYSDFQCPACAFYAPLLKKLSEEFGDKIVIAYRHFPLPQHQNAKSAAYAAEAAGRQGKFWDMHDLIFSNQRDWEGKKDAADIFISYAQTLNLNLDQFKTDFTSEEIREKVEDAYQNSTSLKLNYTPTLFLNGEKLVNPKNYEDLRSIITQALNENS